LFPQWAAGYSTAALPNKSTRGAAESLAVAVDGDPVEA
jgi:hypothetical protein